MIGGLTRRSMVAGLALALAVPAQAAPAPKRSDEARLMALFAADARRGKALNPLDAIYRGETVSTVQFARIFDPAVDAERRASVAASLAALSRIQRKRLTPARQISYDVFGYEKRIERASLTPAALALTSVRPMNHFGGLHVEFPSLVAAGGALPYRTAADYRAALALERAFPGVLDRAIARYREGIGSGVVETKLTTRNMIAQIDALLAQGTKDSPFTSAVREFPAAVPRSARPALTTGFNAAWERELKPAYARLRTFLNDEYLPAAREEVGLSAMKGGTALYDRLIEEQTTLRRNPDEVHRLGLSEVARIQAEMDKVKAELGFTGPLRAFFDEVRTNLRYHPQTGEELAAGFKRIGRAVDAQIPRYFSKIPRSKLVIEPYPEYRAKYEAGGSYNQGSADGARPGVFFFNTYDIKSRFLTGMATLYLHEGIPGHHFQISLAQENASLPDFQRFGGNTAFVEGWALYAETLGYPMGLYADPMQHWGTLDDEMLRAMRLVVDTGLHTKRWSREQAIDYMLANSGMGRSDATAEVERYIANPAQALAYKVGALTIQRLRAKAEEKLGAKFDIRAFHEQVLGSGALPLPILEDKIDRWVAGR